MAIRAPAVDCGGCRCDAAGRGAVHPEDASHIGAGAAGGEHGDNLGPFE